MLNGYQKWHINLDDEVVEWVTNNREAIYDDFLDFLREVYDRPDMKKRFPDGMGGL